MISNLLSITLAKAVHQVRLGHFRIDVVGRSFIKTHLHADNPTHEVSSGLAALERIGRLGESGKAAEL